MASNHNHKKDVRVLIFLCMALSRMLRNELVDGREISIQTNNKVIKTQDGEIIDCVDIYEQPAFSHPLLKNHTLQMEPSSYPGGPEAGNFPVGLSQSWHKYEKCPSGTIPFSRKQSNGYKNVKKGIPFVPSRTQLNIRNELIDPTHEYAQVSLAGAGNKLYGATANVGVWTPATFDGEYSFSQIWVTTGQGPDLNTIEAGWLVKENNTKFFIYWTRDGYKNTGCYNLDCPGFVQVNKQITLGGILAPVSVYGGVQIQIKISIFKDKQAGNWWLQVQDKPVGYWPGSIFTGLAGSATSIIWGGEIINHATEGRHTSTQMGSGHFPVEGPGKVGVFRNIGYMGVNDEGTFRDPTKLSPYASKPSCYDVQIEQSEATDGVHFFYGGPGYSDKCP